MYIHANSSLELGIHVGSLCRAHVYFVIITNNMRPTVRKKRKRQQKTRVILGEGNEQFTEFFSRRRKKTKINASCAQSMTNM